MKSRAKYYFLMPGIIWIFTNNKNSPGNSPETAKRNREFYQLLHEEPSIVRASAPFLTVGSLDAFKALAYSC